jgi:hypothetical protein
VYLFRIIIPETELRRASPDRTPAQELVWCPPPQVGHCAQVELWLTPPVTQRPNADNFVNQLLGVLTVEGGRFVGVTVLDAEIQPADLRQLTWLRSNMAQGDERCDPRSRGWALTRTRQEVYSLLEYAPFQDEAA